jgi:hypothetical protein
MKNFLQTYSPGILLSVFITLPTDSWRIIPYHRRSYIRDNLWNAGGPMETAGHFTRWNKICDTSSVVAAGYSYSNAAGNFTTIVKLTRTLMIIPVTPLPMVSQKSRTTSLTLASL